MLTDVERKRIAEAISAVERQTSGEIIAVLAAESDTYTYAPILWAAIVALLVPWPLIHFTWIAVQWIFLIQLAVFCVLLALIWPRHVRTALVPRAIRARHAHRRATEQFIAQNLHTTEGRTGVLIFVSVAERHAEILADKGIDDRVSDGTWQDIVNELTAEISEGRAANGFIRAIERAGNHLSQHFPPGTANPNELPDHLIVLG